MTQTIPEAGKAWALCLDLGKDGISMVYECKITSSDIQLSISSDNYYEPQPAEINPDVQNLGVVNDVELELLDSTQKNLQVMQEFITNQKLIEFFEADHKVDLVTANPLFGGPAAIKEAAQKCNQKKNDVIQEMRVNYSNGWPKIDNFDQALSGRAQEIERRRDEISKILAVVDGLNTPVNKTKDNVIH